MNTSSNELTNIQVLNDDGSDANQKQPRIVDDGDFVYDSVSLGSYYGFYGGTSTSTSWEEDRSS